MTSTVATKKKVVRKVAKKPVKATLSFQEAVNLIKENPGTKVCRASNTSTFVFFVPAEKNSNLIKSEFFAKVFAKRKTLNVGAIFASFNGKELTLGYMPSVEDMMASDWMVKK